MPKGILTNTIYCRNIFFFTLLSSSFTLFFIFRRLSFYLICVTCSFLTVIVSIIDLIYTLKFVSFFFVLSRLFFYGNKMSSIYSCIWIWFEHQKTINYFIKKNGNTDKRRIHYLLYNINAYIINVYLKDFFHSVEYRYLSYEHTVASE